MQALDQKKMTIMQKSTTGYIIYIGSGPVCWRTKKQKFTARSTTEAEFDATADLIEKIILLNNLNKELEGRVLLCQTFCDNLSNIKILTNEKKELIRQDTLI